MKRPKKCIELATIASIALAVSTSCATTLTATEPGSAAPATASFAPAPAGEATPTSSNTASDASAALGGYEVALPDPMGFAPTQAPYQAPAPPPQKHHHAMVLIGERQLEDSAWEGMQDQFMLGVTFDKQLGDSGLAVDAGFLFSGDSTVHTTGSPPVGTEIYLDVFEFDLGLLKMFYLEKLPLRPYIGAGAAMAWARGRFWNVYYRSDTDFTWGMYGRAGLAYQHGSGALVGFDFHYLGLTDVDPGAVDSNIDGWVFSVALGYGF